MGTGTQKIFIGFGQMKGESESKGTNGTGLKKSTKLLMFKFELRAIRFK